MVDIVYLKNTKGHKRGKQIKSAKYSVTNEYNINKKSAPYKIKGALFYFNSFNFFTISTLTDLVTCE